MQIVKQTSSELSLRNQPSRLRKGFISLWALLFSGIPLVMMGAWIYGLGVTQLSCQRVEPTQVSCDSTQTRFLGFISGPSITFDQVTAAEMKTLSSDDDSVRTIDNWVVLQTSNGEVTYLQDPMRINGRKGAADEMQAITDQINQFINSDQANLAIQRDLRFRLGNSIFPLGFMGLFVLIGGTVVYFSFRSEELVFDKTTRQFRCRRQTLLGTKTWQCPLNEIQDVVVDIQTDRNGDAIYGLKFIPQQGKQSLIPGPKHDVETACKTIRAFLNGQAEAPMTPDKIIMVDIGFGA
ncbi:MAG: hypothetical protein F6K11_23900 [Leptolyngbya sp. SIO3F4]|nr:hypothetical protein [Leptolyngbya sp. SIO3F4]